MLIISLPIGLLVIGPVISLFTDLLTQGFAAIYDLLTCTNTSSCWFCLANFSSIGLHWAIIPLSIMNVTNLQMIQF